MTRHFVTTNLRPQRLTASTQIVRGPAGSDGGTFVKDTAIAAISLSGQRVVCKNSSNQLIYADPDLDNYGVLGITTSAISQGVLGEYLVAGILEEPSWSWIPGKPLFLQNNGQISQFPPNTGFLLRVGKALTSSKIFVQIQLLIKR